MVPSPRPAEDGPALRPIRPPRDVATPLGAGLVVAGAVLAHWAFPDDLAFLTRVVCLSIFVLSLDLIVGYCGIATLGHAALYGAGAYAAGILAVHGGVQSPLALLAAGGAAGCVAGIVSGLVVTQPRVLSQVVISIAVVQLSSALANKLRWLTGGSDGLSGIAVAPLFGRFEFDFYGHTAFWLAVALLVLVLVGLRRLMMSPFGLLCRAVKGDPVRVLAMGVRVKPALVVMYAVSGAVAGLAGALAAVTSGVVGLDSTSFERSAEALIMLVLGGTGTLFGGLVGTLLFQFAEHTVSAINPFHWLTLIGAVLVAATLLLPGGLWSGVGALRRRLSPKRGGTP